MLEVHRLIGVKLLDLLVIEISAEHLSCQIAVLHIDKEFLGGRDRSLSADDHIAVFHRVELILGELLLGHGMRLFLHVVEVEIADVVGAEEVKHHAGDEKQPDGNAGVDERNLVSCLHGLSSLLKQ